MQGALRRRQDMQQYGLIGLHRDNSLIGTCRLPQRAPILEHLDIDVAAQAGDLQPDLPAEWDELDPVFRVP
ncbi:MAG TPA: hypothetical protein VHO49_14580, partial [Anaerolineales bacterium]|nr:hypothetical protein [Anaerolineales bacterium]